MSVKIGVHGWTVVGLTMVLSLSLAAPGHAAPNKRIPLPPHYTNSVAGWSYLVDVAPDTGTIVVRIPSGTDDVKGTASIEVQGYDTLVEASSIALTAGTATVPVDPHIFTQRSAPCPPPVSTDDGCFYVLVEAGRFSGQASLRLVPGASMPVATVDYATSPGADYVLRQTYFKDPPVVRAVPLAWGQKVAFTSKTPGLWTAGPAGTAGNGRLTAHFVGYENGCRAATGAQPFTRAGCARSTKLAYVISADGSSVTVTMPRQRPWSTAGLEREFIALEWVKATRVGKDTMTYTRVVKVP